VGGWVRACVLVGEVVVRVGEMGALVSERRDCDLVGG